MNEPKDISDLSPEEQAEYCRIYDAMQAAYEDSLLEDESQIQKFTQKS